MNKLRGKIIEIKTSDNLSIVSVSVTDDIMLKAIVIETPGTASYLKVGNIVSMLFKETEVILGTDKDLPISLQNKINGVVSSIERGDLLSRITLDTEGEKIISIISSNAVSELGLDKGIKATAFIKLNEVMISEK